MTHTDSIHCAPRTRHPSNVKFKPGIKINSFYSKLALVFATILHTVGCHAYTPVPKDGVVGWSWGKHFSNRPNGVAVGANSNDWILSTAGWIENDVLIPHEDQIIFNNTNTTASYNNKYKYKITIAAYGASSGGVTPAMRVEAGNRAGIGPQPESMVQIAAVSLLDTHTSASPLQFEIPNVILPPGRRTVRIKLDNPSGFGDRKLYIREIKIEYANQNANLPANNGTFNYQSISILGGFFGTMKGQFGLTEPCSSTLPGCLAIDFAKAIGASDVTITTVCDIASTTNQNWCSPNINWNESEFALRVAIRYARSKGLSVTLKPFITRDQKPLASNGWVPTNADGFFTSIQTTLVHQATIAREEGVSIFMIGAELGGGITSYNAFNNSCQRWLSLIDNVKTAGKRPDGTQALKYTYSPTAAGFWNNAAANEAPYVCFWGEMDYIGVNAYPHFNYQDAKITSTNVEKIGSTWSAYSRMFDPTNGPVQGDCDDLYVFGVDYSNCPISPSPTVSPAPNFQPNDPTLLAQSPWMDLSSTNTGSYRAKYNTRNFSMKWYVNYIVDEINKQIQGRLKARGINLPLQAILTEVGAPSNHNIHAYWGNTLNGQETVSYDMALQPRYVSEQAKAWDGYLRSFRGDPRIAGISIWGLEPYHDRYWTGYDEGSRGWLLGYDFNAKSNSQISLTDPSSFVTEEVLCNWFKKAFVPSGGKCYGAAAQ